MVANNGLREILTPAGVTVTVALALFVVSAPLVAVTVCVPACEGAVYIPVALIVPAVAFPPATISTDQVTAVFVVFCTVALNCILAPAAIFAEL
jgi:hypothetical protein